MKSQGGSALTPLKRSFRKLSFATWAASSQALQVSRTLTVGFTGSKTNGLNKAKQTSHSLFLNRFQSAGRLCCVLTVLSDSLRPHGPQPSRLLCPRDPPGKSPSVGCHALLQGIFPTQELNPGLLRCRRTLHRLNHQRCHIGRREECRS